MIAKGEPRSPLALTHLMGGWCSLYIIFTHSQNCRGQSPAQFADCCMKVLPAHLSKADKTLSVVRLLLPTRRCATQRGASPKSKMVRHSRVRVASSRASIVLCSLFCIYFETRGKTSTRALSLSGVVKRSEIMKEKRTLKRLSTHTSLSTRDIGNGKHPP